MGLSERPGFMSRVDFESIVMKGLKYVKLYSHVEVVFSMTGTFIGLGLGRCEGAEWFSSVCAIGDRFMKPT